MVTTSNVTLAPLVTAYESFLLMIVPLFIILEHQTKLFFLKLERLQDMNLFMQLYALLSSW